MATPTFQKGDRVAFKESPEVVEGTIVEPWKGNFYRVTWESGLSYQGKNHHRERERHPEEGSARASGWTRGHRGRGCLGGSSSLAAGGRAGPPARPVLISQLAHQHEREGTGGTDLQATSIEQSAERGGLHVPKCRTPGCPNEASEDAAYCDGCLQSRQPPSPPVQPPPVKRSYVQQRPSRVPPERVMRPGRRPGGSGQKSR